MWAGEACNHPPPDPRLPSIIGASRVWTWLGLDQVPGSSVKSQVACSLTAQGLLDVTLGESLWWVHTPALPPLKPIIINYIWKVGHEILYFRFVRATALCLSNWVASVLFQPWTWCISESRLEHVSGDAECQFISMWWKVFWQILPGQEFWSARKW